ncbi:phenol degradation protein meta [Pseudomonas protegens]|uniref:SphA family protein n=1 Tax=Pseudomonas protegens TaxID=380021 RepID=UPI000806F912|nr:transporter [Pseudomonas protegens]OBZ23366.1 phenol degradation protein meta [Pseudomonas protegens]OBZ30263.1 phenol degradation protein meta [Pseudomonas protegens]OKK44596.1 phenol degradation protein meta [Pseudomonas protegens]OKK50562.1 phenol degradation protein meta [Pseudomonas protegens]OKK56624.1 phenol degradation protein meta [Pseudomonas protegens]
MPSPSPLRSSLALCLLAASPLLHAAEGGVGRPITGQQIYSNAGIIPPEPGWVMSLTSIYYDGELKGSGQVPIIGDLSSGLKMKVSYTMGNFTRVWDTGKGRWNYASAIGVPVQYTDIQACLTGPRGRTVGTQDSGTQFADLLVTPIAAGYHINERDHIALSLPIYVPTGAYNDNRLANPGQNNYTFMPTIAFTHLDGKGGEFSLMGSLEFYTRNDAADYRNGDILRLDGLWTHGFGSGWNAGLVVGYIQQISDDQGPTADKLNGYRGRSVGAGPTLGWSGKFADAQANISARWIPEFDTKNRPEGNGVSVNLTLAFF